MRFLSFMNTSTGRMIRVVAGIVILVAGVLLGGGVGAALAVFAVLPIATGVFGLCPINPLFGQPMRACAVPVKRARHL
jgi:glucose dehydrogenase